MQIEDIINTKQSYSYDINSFDYSEQEKEKETNSEVSFKTNQIINESNSIEKAFENIFVEKSLIEKELPIYIIKKEKTNRLSKHKFIAKKRGRKQNNIDTKRSNKKRKREHSASDWDNNLRKIQAHFLNFIVLLLNDIIKSNVERKGLLLYKFNYEEKKNINYNYVETLKNYNIKELLEKFEASPKYTKVKLEKKKYVNREILDNLCKYKYKWFNELINKNILYFFKIYYNNKKKLKNIFFNGKQIILSKDTQNFYDLLQKYKEYEKKLIEAAESVFLNNYN